MIRDAVREVVPAGIKYELRLFGSRLDDNLKGGDVDLYLEIDGVGVEAQATLQRTLRSRLEEALDMPVDLVVQQRREPLKLVSRIAKEGGVSLL